MRLETEAWRHIHGIGGIATNPAAVTQNAVEPCELLAIEERSHQLVYTPSFVVGKRRTHQDAVVVPHAIARTVKGAYDRPGGLVIACA